MTKVNPKELDQSTNYGLLSASVVPRPIAFVTTLNTDGSVNAAPFSFFTVLTPNPPLVVVSVLRDNGLVKDTAKNILNNKEFVIHLVDEDLLEQMNIAAARLKYGESEVELAKLTEVESTKIKTPAIAEAKIRFEVKLKQHIELGDKGNITADMFIGEVLLYQFDKSVYDNGCILLDKFKAVGRLAGPEYIKLTDIINIERPT